MMRTTWVPARSRGVGKGKRHGGVTMSQKPDRRAISIDGTLLGAWRRFVGWMRNVPVDAPQGKRNALTLQAMLVITGAIAWSMAAISYVTADAVGLGESWHTLTIGAYAWTCFYLLRIGLFRLSASLTVIGGLFLIGLSYQTYGLRAQSGLQITHLLPLLLAGLLLGRGAVWWTALANAIALTIGARVDLGLATNAAARAEAWSDLLLSGMNLFVLAAILDRLILLLQRAIKRSEELDTICLELEREIEEKERAYARLLQTQRMEAIGRLSTGIAHDFHNILSVILGLATSPAQLNDSTDIILPKVAKAARRGTAITRRLLSFGRTQTGEVATFDLVEAVDEMHSLILPMFHRGIRVQMNLPSPGLCVRMDRDELELVLLNIASNACDAMPHGGLFTLSVESDEDHVQMRMEDTGEGMTPDVLARLFEPFFTTKPKDKGTGIGMAIVHRFVADSGGEIDVDSLPDQGTRIRIKIPLASRECESGMTSTREVSESHWPPTTSKASSL